MTPLVGDNQDGVAGPFTGCIHQGILASLPHTDAIFSSRRAKLPAESFGFIQLVQFFIFNFISRFSGPFAPVLFSKPRIGFKRNLQMKD